MSTETKKMTLADELREYEARERDNLAPGARGRMLRAAFELEDLRSMLLVAVRPPLKSERAIHFAEQFEVGWKVTVWGPVGPHEDERDLGEEFIVPDDGGVPQVTAELRAALRAGEAS